MLGGKHHLLGDLAIVSEGTFKGAVGKILEILSIHKDTSKIVLPPIPRYLKGSCCEAAEHGGNTRDPSGFPGVVAKLGNLRKILKEVLVKSTLKGVWVPDVVEELLGRDTPVGFEDLDKTFAKDNVHLSPESSLKVAEIIRGGVLKLGERSATAAASSVSGTGGYYWRGFSSFHGATRSNRPEVRVDRRDHHARGGLRGSNYRGRGGRGHFHHPYTRRN